jgi:CHAT domain-containing protein
MDSALILSPSPKGYRLRASEIAAHKINAKLVTLASCRSAGNRVSSGGLLGMAWAFLRAGAGSVIASLHDVDDKAARQLSRDLYAGLKSGLPPERALREAKLKMMNGSEFASPDHWGAWIMIVGR